MHAIEELKTEHQAVKLTLRILKRIVERVDATKKIDHPEHLAQLFDFFETFVDRCHHAKEEELLFPALEEVGISRDGGPVGVMLKEHQQGRELVAGMKAAVSDCLGSRSEAVHKFTRQADAYITLLNFHIEKEDHVLFPLAIKHLSPGSAGQLKEGFDRIEREEVGDGRHEAFHAMLDRLAGIYLE